MKPFLHANIHVKKYGGVREDYYDIDTFIDSSKEYFADVRHRAILHNTIGCFLVERIFGITRLNSANKLYSPRDVAEDHILQDLGKIFTVEQYLRNIKIENLPKKTEYSVENHSEIDAELLNIEYQFVKPIHELTDSIFYNLPDQRADTIYHTGFGVFLLSKQLPLFLTDINGIKIETLQIIKNHIIREYGYIPCLSDFLNTMNIHPWMSGTEKRRTVKLKQQLED